jgi:hypothetical protein
MRHTHTDHDYHQHVVENVKKMQDDCTPMSAELFSLINSIGKLHGWESEFPNLIPDDVDIISFDGISSSESAVKKANGVKALASRAAASPAFVSPNMPGLGSPHVNNNPEGKDVVGYCEFLCTLVEEAISNDVLSVPVDSISSGLGFQSRTTVGMLLVGMSIDNMVVGGPAYNCQQLNKGDLLMRVDDEEVGLHDIHEKLVGSDIPGTFVKVAVLSPETMEEKEVMLTRMATATIADNVRMFELFTALKDRALHDRDDDSMIHIDDLISLWSRMLLNTANNHNTVCSNVLNLQTNCIRWLQDMRFSFRRLRREGYVQRDEKSDELSEWLMGPAEDMKRPSSHFSQAQSYPSYLPLDESRGLFQTPLSVSAVA